MKDPAVEPQFKEIHSAPDSQNLDISKRLEIAERRLKIADNMLRFQDKMFWSPRYGKWRLEGVHFDTFELCLDAAEKGLQK